MIFTAGLHLVIIIERSWRSITPSLLPSPLGPGDGLGLDDEGDGDGDGLGEGLGLGEGDGDGLGATEGEGDGEGEGLGDGLGEGEGDIDGLGEGAIPPGIAPAAKLWISVSFKARFQYMTSSMTPFKVSSVSKGLRPIMIWAVPLVVGDPWVGIKAGGELLT